jgi:RNA polymerase primary sigma factor
VTPVEIIPSHRGGGTAARSNSNVNIQSRIQSLFDDDDADANRSKENNKPVRPTKSTKKKTVNQSSKPKETTKNSVKSNSAGYSSSSTLKASVRETGNDTMRSYLKSMGSHELLRQEDEVVLGRQIQILVKWEEAKALLEEKLLRTPTDEEWAESIGTNLANLRTQIRRSQRAKTALVEANLRLVVSIARQVVRHKNTNINFQDACQEGIIGLSRACDKFDPEKGFRFSTYANWWIKKEVQKSCIDQKRFGGVRLPYHVVRKVNLIRITEVTMKEELGRKPRDEELAEKLDMTTTQLAFYRKASQEAFSLDKTIKSQKTKGSSASTGGSSGDNTFQELLPCPDSTPVDLANTEMLKDDVRRLIKTLSPREQAVIRLRFGLDDGKGKTLDDIGGKFGVTTDMIRKIEARALLKLRQPYRNHSVKCYISDL